MNKRTFLKTSAAVLAGGLISPLISCRSEDAAASRTNWAGNLTYGTDRLHLPRTVAEAQEIIRTSDKIRPLGSRHCFNAIADSASSQISLEHLNAVVDLDEPSNSVTVESGILYGDLSSYLHERGYALHNLASLPHISVAGACATATHGSGAENGNLATAVSAIEFVDADGNLHTLSRVDDGDLFPGAVVGLGALGLITRLTLDIEPTFDVIQHVYLNLPRSALDDHFDEIMSSGYSVSLFTDYQSDTINQVWVKQKVDGEDVAEAEPDFYGAQPASRNVHPIIELSAENCTEQMGVPGPWHERLPHFRMDFTPSSGEELQAEYFVHRDAASEVVRLLYGMGQRLRSLLMISEIRTIAEDDLWMSTCYGRPSVAFHLTCEQDWDSLRQLLPVIEDALEPYDVRPHWGKMFTMSPSRLQSQYERLAQFRTLVHRYDPNGKFRNAFLEDNVVA